MTSWIHAAGAAVAAIVVCSFTDWYFFGVLFHDRYQRTPGIWKKYQDKGDEMRSILWSLGWQSLTSVIFVGACMALNMTTWGSALGLAGGAWVMLPLPLLQSFSIFIPMDRLILLSHSLGWLARLLLTGVCVALSA